MTFKTGDKVRVTPEYAAWYRRNGIGAPPVKPSDVLIIEQIDDDGIIRFREDVESPARIGMTLPEYLVSAESETP